MEFENLSASILIPMNALRGGSGGQIRAYEVMIRYEAVFNLMIDAHRIQ